MDIFSIVLIAFGLAMDAFAVSITSGIIVPNIKFRNAIKIAIFFGVFQGLMPFIGWVAGIKFKSYISQIDHWIAFVLLGIIGIKMIYEALKEDKDEESFNPFLN